MRAAGGDGRRVIAIVKDFQMDKYMELQSVQVAATFCGGAVFSSLPLARTGKAVWACEALWLTSLVCSICAIITSIQTRSLLDDLPCREQLNDSLPEPDVQRVQRAILRYKKRPGIKHWIMVFIWQFPSMMMSYAWCTYLAGLTVYVCSPLMQRRPWQDQDKIAIVFLCCGFVGLVTYISATIFVYTGEKDYYQRSVVSSQTTEPSNGSLDMQDIRKTVAANARGAAGRVVDKKATAGDETMPHATTSPFWIETAYEKVVASFQHPEPRVEEPERRRRRWMLY
ncbi:hypothetical protein ACEQ8H_006146 [Pleosporales sp. CAS-2024a]